MKTCKIGPVTDIDQYRKDMYVWLTFLVHASAMKLEFECTDTSCGDGSIDLRVDGSRKLFLPIVTAVTELCTVINSCI
jgi:hypothetical protein